MSSHWGDAPYDTENAGPSREQLEDQVDALADLLRMAYVLAGDTGADDLTEQIEDLFYDLGLEL